MNPDSFQPLPQVETAVEDRLRELEAQVVHLQTALDQDCSLFQNSPVASMLLDSHGRVLEINAKGVALLRSERQFLLGRPLAASLTMSSERTLQTLLARVFEGRGSQKGELQFTSANGQVLELALEAVLVEGGTASPRCHLTLTDVTAFKLAHRALWEAEQAQALQVGRQTRTLRELQEEFEEVVVVAGRELNHTLARIEGFLALAQRQPDMPSHLPHAGMALRQTQNLLESLKRHMQARFMRTRSRRVNLNQVLREALKDLEEQKADRDVQITAVPLPTIEGDSQVLQIILGEYLSNALKFTRTRPQARLNILLEEDETEFRIGVQDNGVGFNMRQKEKAFELFGRLHSSQQYEGTGLGLTTVRRLCERFGGRAWGEGKVDQGATFWFSWLKSGAKN